MKKLKLGDEVIMSDRNPNHLGYGVCAYSGMKGIVSEICDDGAFVLNCGTSTLVVPMVIYGKPKSIWIWVNGNLIKYWGNKLMVDSLITNKSDVNVTLFNKFIYNILPIGYVLLVIGMIIYLFIIKNN